MTTSLRRLLLVDDDPLQLKLMKLTLEGQGYSVQTASDGQAALESLPLNLPDGIISDVLMPRLDGFQLCHALRQDDRFSHLPVVLLSAAYTEQEDLRLAKDLGAKALLARIPNIQDLTLQVVKSLILAPGPGTPNIVWPSEDYQQSFVHQLKRQAQHPKEVSTPQDSQERLRRMEEKLCHSQKLESIGQIAAGVAHELNNPLSAILGFIDCLIRKPDAPDLVDVLRIMRREGLRCSTLIQDMLTFTRKSGTQAVWAQLPQLADGILGLIGARAKTMRVDIEKEYQANIPPAFVNGNQIQQVLMNLCMNALDAMPKGGILTLTIGLVGNDFILRVRDTGEGMTQDHAKRIFEPFFTTKEAGKGTGLGLSLVHEIVTTHKGSVTVQSELGRGTTFEVRLPREEAILP